MQLSLMLTCFKHLLPIICDALTEYKEKGRIPGANLKICAIYILVLGIIDPLDAFGSYLD